MNRSNLPSSSSISHESINGTSKRKKKRKKIEEKKRSDKQERNIRNVCHVAANPRRTKTLRYRWSALENRPLGTQSIREQWTTFHKAVYEWKLPEMLSCFGATREIHRSLWENHHCVAQARIIESSLSLSFSVCFFLDSSHHTQTDRLRVKAFSIYSWFHPDIIISSMLTTIEDGR